jgi:hypothetical protein
MVAAQGDIAQAAGFIAPPAFAMRGNVLDMDVGINIGAAFGRVVS